MNFNEWINYSRRALTTYSPSVCRPFAPQEHTTTTHYQSLPLDCGLFWSPIIIIVCLNSRNQLITRTTNGLINGHLLVSSRGVSLRSWRWRMQVQQLIDLWAILSICIRRRLRRPTQQHDTNYALTWTEVRTTTGNDRSHRHCIVA